MATADSNRHPDNEHGEIKAQVNLGTTSFKQLMLGDKLDIMNFKWFQLDFKHENLRVANEELVLYRKIVEMVRVIPAKYI